MTQRVFLSCIFACLLVFNTVDKVHAKQSEEKPLVQVGEWRLYKKQVDQKIAAKLFQLETKRFTYRLQAVQEALTTHLLQLEAKAKGVDADKLLDTVVKKQFVPIESKDVIDFIEENKKRLPSSIKGLEDKVKMFLEQEQKEEIRSKYLSSLAEKYDARMTLKPPKPPRINVPGPNSSAKGRAGAPITIIEFSDFECPYCRRAHQTVQQLLRVYPGRIRLIFRHFPLPGHQHAVKASEASLCAEKQGKFWQYHDALFDQKGWQKKDGFKTLAKSLSLDMKSFNHCLDSGEMNARVKQDKAIGSGLGVTGTPHFFINGVSQSGAIPLETFRKLIDAELKKISATK
ncbi:DsbA family protein [Magnetococcales bacterium HHB-1]